MLETETGVSETPRAFLQVGASSVAGHQLAVALALECRRIVCLAREFSAELIVLQHKAERAGAQFHVAQGPRALSSLIGAQDEVVLFADGLLAAPEEAMALLDAGEAVVVQPVESGIEAGFERIDLNHATAGAMRIPGRLIERLSEMPGDCDVFSTLMRIALQNGIAQRLLPASAQKDWRWKLVRGEAEAHSAESGWIAMHMGASSGASAGDRAARLLVRWLGPALLHAGSGGNAVVIAALAAGLIGMVLGWFEFTAAGLVLCGIAWIIRRAGALLTRIELDSLELGPSGMPREQIFGWLLDAAILAVLVWSPPLYPWATLIWRLFAPLMLLCVLRLGPRAIARPGTVWLEDRAMLAFILALAAGLGVLHYAIYIGSIVIALVGILYPRSKARIT